MTEVFERNISNDFPSLGDITYGFLSSSLGAPFFILDPEQHLRVVLANPQAARYFGVGENASEDWFCQLWPEANKPEWRQQFISEMAKTDKKYVLIPSHLMKATSVSQELCFIRFPVSERYYIAAVILNADTRTLSNFDPSAIRNALKLGEFYNAILDNLHDSVGLFEFDEQKRLRVTWLNDRAMRYVAPIRKVSGHFVVSFLPQEIRASWLQLEQSLLDATQNICCTFLLGEGENQFACEIYFHPVTLQGASGKQFIANWFNVTKHFQKELAESRRRQDFFNLVENAPDIIVRYDAKGRRTYANKAYEEMTGTHREEVVGLLPTEYSGIGTSAAAIQGIVQDTISQRQRQKNVFKMSLKGNPDGVFEVRCMPEFDRSENVIGVLLVARDITQEVKATERTKVSEELFRTLVENSPDYICRYDLECRLIYSNPVSAKLFACPIKDMLGLTPTQLRDHLYLNFDNKIPKGEAPLHSHIRDVVDSGKGKECEVSGPTTRGEVHSYVSITPEYNREGLMTSVLVIGRDITELKEYQEQVSYLSKYDALTGLPNRTTLLNKVSSQLLQFPPISRKVGLLVLGVDHFKSVNDSLGYEYGDIVLKALTERLKEVAPINSTLARLGGDEFGVFLASVQDRDSFTNEAERINRALARPVVVGERDVNVSVSIGACMYPDDAQDLEELVRYADSALYDAKTNQRGGIRFYSQDLTTKALERMELRNSLRTAINKREFCVYMQPKINIKTGELMGGEALVRWCHPKRGMIYPDAFIPIAEEAGLITEIDMLVLDELCKHLALWCQYLTKGQRFAVNLSAVQFKRECLVPSILAAVDRYKVDTTYIELEITEGVLLVHEAGLANKIKELKAAGFTLALDDFGTGYSSLSYLSRYPLDTLKIDRSFINEMVDSGSSRVLVKTIVSMAQSLNMNLVAEGVEEQVQADILSEFGVEIAQGYFYAKPIPLVDFAQRFFGIATTEV